MDVKSKDIDLMTTTKKLLIILLVTLTSVWARQSSLNYRWLYDLFVALCDEYTYRYGKRHSTDEKLRVALAMKPINILRKHLHNQPAMSHYPDCIVEGDSLKSYHNYYIQAKNSFAKWTKRSVQHGTN